MAKFNFTQTINCKTDETFAAVTDILNWPKWNPVVVSVEQTIGESVDIGSQFVLKIEKFGNQTMAVTELEAGRSITYSPVSKMFKGGHKWTISKQAGKTQIDHSVDLSLDAMARKNTKAEAASIQNHLER